MPPACNAFLPLVCLQKCPHPSGPAEAQPSFWSPLGLPWSAILTPTLSWVNAWLPCLLLSIWPVLPSFAVYLCMYLSISLFFMMYLISWVLIINSRSGTVSYTFVSLFLAQDRSCGRSATETRARERQLGFGQRSWPPDPRTHAFYTIMHMCWVQKGGCSEKQVVFKNCIIKTFFILFSTIKLT